MCVVGLLYASSVGMRCGVGALEVREWKIFDKIATWFLRVGLNVMNAPATRSEPSENLSVPLPAGCARNVWDLPE
jgi:hypothetical protein